MKYPIYNTLKMEWDYINIKEENENATFNKVSNNYNNSKFNRIGYFDNSEYKNKQKLEESKMKAIKSFVVVNECDVTDFNNQVGVWTQRIQELGREVEIQTHITGTMSNDLMFHAILIGREEK